MHWRAIATWLGFQIVWLVCAIGASVGESATGIMAALLFTATVVVWHGGTARHLTIVAVSGLCGCVVDSGLAMAGLIRFATSWPIENVAPGWSVSLWLAFGATIPMLTATLGANRLALSAALGAAAGPLAYFAGARVGALQILARPGSAIVALALVWAIALPCLVTLDARLARAR